MVPRILIGAYIPEMLFRDLSATALFQGLSRSEMIEIALVIQSEVGAELLLPVQDTPVNAVLDGERYIVSPTAALLYAANKF